MLHNLHRLIKITDFGIAMALNSTQLTQTNSVMGSVHYLPPEQAGGKSATTKSDIYSAGILMYELLTGNVPFKGDNAVEIALKQMKEKLPSIRKQNPLIPQSVENIVLKATAKNPKNRYDNIRDMHDDLVHALDADKENEMKWKYPYPESELDESRAIPIKDAPVVSNKNNSYVEPPSDDSDDAIDVIEKKMGTKTKVLIAVGIFVLVVLLGLLIFFNNKNRYKVVVVPDVVGMKLDKAKTTLKKKGFQYEIKTEASDEVDEGKVIKTNPTAGSSKKKGSIITVVSSSGVADVDLKNYVDQKVDTVKEKLESLGLEVKVEKKEVDSPKDYIGKKDLIIDQDPKYNPDEERKLKKDDVIILYYPDILEEYPDMVNDGWTLAKAEEFATKYGLTLNVKDKKDNKISDYSSYLDNAIVGQNRSGKIASGVTFTVNVDIDTTTYNLIINYLDKNNQNKAIGNTKTETHMNGDNGTVTCQGFAGYKAEKASIPYKIEGKDLTVNCYYTKDSDDSTDTDGEDNH